MLDGAAPPASVLRAIDGHSIPPCDSRTLCTDIGCAVHMWWTCNDLALRCPHGFVALGGAFAFRCNNPVCLRVAEETLRRAVASTINLPLREDPIRWPGEVRLPSECGAAVLPFLSVWSPPRYEAICLFEHSGAFRAAWAQRGIPVASVADRPSSTPPEPGSNHIIALARRFHAWYPHPISFVTTHWTCSKVSYAGRSNFRRNMESGDIVTAVEDAVWSMCIAPRFASEQPPVMLEYVLGEPAMRTEVRLFGAPVVKEWWWWTSPDLQLPSPTIEVPSQ